MAITVAGSALLDQVVAAERHPDVPLDINAAKVLAAGHDVGGEPLDASAAGRGAEVMVHGMCERNVEDHLPARPSRVVQLIAELYGAVVPLTGQGTQ
jgi:hypothetical protein